MLPATQHERPQSKNIAEEKDRTNIKILVQIIICGLSAWAFQKLSPAAPQTPTPAPHTHTYTIDVPSWARGSLHRRKSMHMIDGGRRNERRRSNCPAVAPPDRGHEAGTGGPARAGAMLAASSHGVAGPDQGCEAGERGSGASLVPLAPDRNTAARCHATAR